MSGAENSGAAVRFALDGVAHWLEQPEPVEGEPRGARADLVRHRHAVPHAQLAVVLAERQAAPRGRDRRDRVAVVALQLLAAAGAPEAVKARMFWPLATVGVNGAASGVATLTLNPFASTTTVTKQIVDLLTGEAEFDSAKTLAAFALGLTLFVVTLLLNIVALRVVKRYREAYE